MDPYTRGLNDKMGICNFAEDAKLFSSFCIDLC